MAALNRALAFDKRHHGAMCVTKQLHLDVARTLEPPFEYTAPSPKADSASDRAARSADGRSSGEPTVRIPFPPPPATALSING